MNRHPQSVQGACGKRRARGVAMLAPVEIGEGGVELLIDNGLLKHRQTADRKAVGAACLSALERNAQTNALCVDGRCAPATRRREFPRPQWAGSWFSRPWVQDCPLISDTHSKAAVVNILGPRPTGGECLTIPSGAEPQFSDRDTGFRWR